ncbi:MAG: hypothetical protein KDA84_12060 [Planctomycetaceae bacterium]|nr:hypothetical protein [Planctomycetaceae bacterium]
MTVDRSQWLDHVQSVIRSRHYSWLPEGLAGEPVDIAMTYLLTDIMHVCQRTGASFDSVLEQARIQFQDEELNQKLAQESGEEE